MTTTTECAACGKGHYDEGKTCPECNWPNCPSNDRQAANWTASRNRFQLKRIELHERLSEETYCYSANMYFDGRKVGTAENRGRGGADLYHWDRDGDQARVEAYIETLPPTEISTNQFLPMDLEGLCAELVDRYREQRWLKNKCRKNVLFQIVNRTPRDEWHTIKADWKTQKEAVLRALERRYPGETLRIANELIG